MSSGSDGNFATIAAAIQAAPQGSTIEVRGVIGERVVIDRPGVRLRGSSAVLDGALLDGRGIGIHITAADVEVTGFTIRNFERGIVVQNTTNAVITKNEVHSNTNKSSTTTPPPATAAFDGIVLIGASGAQIANNVLRNNGHDGLQVMGGSRNNQIRNNRILENGAQTQPNRFG